MISGKVLITGAAGRIGQILVNGLGDRYDLVLTDRYPLPRPARFPFFQADLTQPDSARALCQGVDTVVHLAGDPRPNAPEESLRLSNIIVTENVFQAAAEAGCRRLIFAGSAMAVDGYPPEFAPLPADLPPRPATFYGATKAVGEELGRTLALKSGTSVLCLRLGWVCRSNEYFLHPRSSALPVMLLTEDWLRLATAAIEAPADLRFGVFNGISDNRVKRLDITETKRVLGYTPRFDSFAVAEANWPAIWRNRAGRLKRWVMKVTGLAEK